MMARIEGPRAAMHKRSISERDICGKFITPALRRARGDEMLQIRSDSTRTAWRRRMARSTLAGCLSTNTQSINASSRGVLAGKFLPRCA
jgi:hypothetical protein